MNFQILKLTFAAIISAGCAMVSGMALGKKPAVPAQTAASAPVYALGQCRIRIANLFGGHFNVPDPTSAPTLGMYYLPETGPMASPMLQGLAVNCIDESEHQSLPELMNVRQDGDRWLQQDLDDNFVPFEDNQHLRVIPLKGSNWTGMGFLTDQTTGDDEQRTRHFKFCLRHKAQTICGETPVALLSKAHSNELPKLEAILKSVVFVDESPLSVPRRTDGAASAPSK